MKLAIDCRMSGKSGIGTFLDGILPYLSEKASLLLIGMPEDKLYNLKKENVQNIPCDVAPFSLQDFFAFPKSITKQINDCDAFFTPYCNVPSGITIPFFSTIHDVVFLDVKLSGTFGTLARKLCYKFACKKSKAIFTVSEFSKKRITHHLNPRKHIYVTYNGLPKYIEETLSTTKIEKKNQIIFIGNIKKHKGLKTLLKAFARFHETTNANLIIIGSKDNFRTKDEETTHIIEENNAGVIFTGFVSDKELLTYIQESRILVQPSLYEGFGIPPLQALHLGTKVIISDIEVFKEIYGNMPVHFFETDNSDDLYSKLLDVWNNEDSVFCPTNFDNPYSYNKTASIIYENIEKECRNVL